MLQVKTASIPRPPTTTGRRVFVSYSHRDHDDVREFVEHLAPLAERHRLDVFFDQSELRAGEVWNEKIAAALDRCDVFLLFVSSACLASRFCMEKELLVALDREGRGLCTVVPVMLKPCAWRDKPLPNASGDTLGRYQGVPGNGITIASRRGASRAALWVQVIDQLKHLLVGDAPGPSRPIGPSAATAVATPGATAGRPVPRLLPYLCDQFIPERRVQEVLRAWQAVPEALLVLMRAESDDCPDKFVDRITERHVRKILARLTPGHELQRHFLQWPSASMARQPDLLESFFLEQVAECVLEDPYATEAEVVARLRDEATHRLFVVGTLPHAPEDVLRATLHGLATTLARLAPQIGQQRLAALLWSEDPVIRAVEFDAAWLNASDLPVRIGLPPALMAFGMQEVRDWAQLDDVRRFVVLERDAVEQAFADAPQPMKMKRFAETVASLLLR